MADPEEIYSEVLTEEQGKGVSAAVAEGRAKAARSRAEAGSPHPKEPKWWPGAQPHLEGGDGAAAAEAAEEPAAEEPAEEQAAEEPAEEQAAEEPAEEQAAEEQAEEQAAEEQAAEEPAEEQPAEAEPAAAQAADKAPQEQAPPAEPAQPAAEAAPQPAAQARPAGVTHGTASGTRVRPEDSVTTEAQYQGQQAVYDRRKLIDELIASGVPATAAADAGERRSPMLFFLYLLIPLMAIAIVLSLDDGAGGGEGPPPEPENGGVTISAANVQFDKQEVTFPADEATTLTLNNEDSVEHNFSIYETEDADADIFVGRNIGAGSSTDYEIPATQAGEYFFRCDLHPTAMVGTAIFE